MILLEVYKESNWEYTFPIFPLKNILHSKAEKKYVTEMNEQITLINSEYTNLEVIPIQSCTRLHFVTTLSIVKMQAKQYLIYLGDQT